MKKSKTLSEKLKSYSAFASALLVSGGAAHAQVIYTDVYPDDTISFEGSYELDLNNDGIVEYTLEKVHNSWGFLDWFGSTSAVYALPAYGNSIAKTSGSYVQVCKYGFNINQELLWSPGGSSTLALSAYGYNYYDKGYSVWWGNWRWQWGKYLPLRFFLDGEQHYGWVRLSIYGGTRGAHTLVIKDYAYESQPNTPIIAGFIANCDAPSGLTSNYLNNSSVVLKWNSVEAAEGYAIQYKVSGTNVWKTKASHHISKNITDLSPNTEYVWRVKAICEIHPAASSPWSAEQTFTTLLKSGELEAETGSNIYPNPFTSSAKISFSLQQTSKVQIELYDVAGRKLQTLLNENLAAGNHEANLNRSDLNEGVYLIKLLVNGKAMMKKVVVQ